MKRAILLSLLSVLMLPYLALASTITYSGSIAETQIPWTQNVYLEKFDATLGALQSVTLMFSIDGFTQYTFTNNMVDPITIISASTYLNTTITDSLNLFTQNVANNISAVSSPIALLSGASFDTNPTHTPYSQYSSSNIYTAASILSEFTGSGSLSLLAHTLGYSSFTIGGEPTNAFAIQQLTTAGLMASVTYEYTDAPHTPEPTTLLLMGSGLAGMIIARRRRGKSRV